MVIQKARVSRCASVVMMTSHLYLSCILLIRLFVVVLSDCLFHLLITVIPLLPHYPDYIIYEPNRFTPILLVIPRHRKHRIT